ncbi:hypothetical protein XIS1_460084 [Xenorhabdus innexi]|uniref:Uncharacterized protein n=1 Tax=Xenorhabdus innexi TaxID=290109 RepID=A0A1N6MYG6_9GAMM|nr:hypothetical protein XIS1_460084 [Xenorhabdus innexi]
MGDGLFCGKITLFLIISFGFYNSNYRLTGNVLICTYSAFPKNKLLRIVFYQVECGLFVMQMEDFVYNC